LRGDQIRQLPLQPVKRGDRVRERRRPSPDLPVPAVDPATKRHHHKIRRDRGIQVPHHHAPYHPRAFHLGKLPLGVLTRMQAQQVVKAETVVGDLVHQTDIDQFRD
jgi:hypothetical protein